MHEPTQQVINHNRGHTYAVLGRCFFIIAIVAAVFGFTGFAVGAASIAKILFFIFLFIFMITLIAYLTRGRRRSL
jgi:uncharacterized membrane protein YtjA (UPF0391 family)